MHVTYVGCVVVYVILADIIVISLAAGPSWDEPAQTTFTLDSTTPGVCDDVTSLIASSSDGSTVEYSISSQTPDGGFGIDLNGVTFVNYLTCTIGSINTESYTVIVSARHNGGNNEETNLTLTIDFSVPAPAWTSGTSYSIDKAVNTACDSVVTLSATSTDSSSVTYSFQSESPAGGGFRVSGSILECDIGSVAATTYTVVVRAQNTGNNAVTDETFTIAVTDSSSGGSGSDSSSGSRDDGWKYGVGFGVAFAFSAAIAVGAYVVYKVLIQKKKNKVKQEKNKNDLKKNDRSDDVKNMQWQHKTS